MSEPLVPGHHRFCAPASACGAASSQKEHRVEPDRHFETVVVGAGVVGACVAYEVSQRGTEVLVVDAGEDVGAGCSWANAGLLSPEHVEPLTTPTNVALGLRYMLRADSPFHVNPNPGLAPWLLRFAASSGPRRAARLTALLRQLARDSLTLHHEYADAGLRTSLRSTGSLDVLLDEKSLERTRRQTLLPGHRLLDEMEARELEPTLGPLAGALWHPDDAMVESRAFVRAVLGAAREHGAETWWRAGVRKILPHRSGVVLDIGHRSISCNTVVLAAGVGTRRLAADCGVRAPLEPGVGYVVDVPPTIGPTRPITFKELKVVATPYPDRLRLSGTMDLGATSGRLDPRRVRAMVAAAGRGMPSVPTGAPLQVWAGQRPCTPDGVPMLGRSARVPEIALAAGHSMWGVILGPISGRLLAEDLAGDRPGALDGAFAPDRFGPAATRRVVRRGARPVTMAHELAHSLGS